MPPLPEHDQAWAVRIRARGRDEVRAYCGMHVFSVGTQTPLRETAHPSAIEYALGALGGDLVHGFRVEAARQSLTVREAELSLAGRLDNVLVHLGVVGEEGHPGLESIVGTLFVSTDAEPSAVEAAWRATLHRSPLFHTFSRCTAVRIELRTAF